MRLRKSEFQWVAGVSLPGVPGILIGQNEKIAWAFTNQGDDVDDYLEEEVDEKAENYVVEIKHKTKIWEAISKKNIGVKVKNKGETIVTSMWTRRGPLSCTSSRVPRCLSRQWLAFKEASLALPILDINRAQNWSEFNTSLNRFVAPSQSALFASKVGQVGFRATGAQINRAPACDRISPWQTGLWNGGIDVSKRPRVLFEREEEKTVQIVNANEQKWESDCPDRWASPYRFLRISQLLKNKSPTSWRDHRDIQLDQFSDFHLRLSKWLLASGQKGISDQVASGKSNILAQWKEWSGYSHQNPEIFSSLLLAEKLMFNFLLNRLNEGYFKKKNRVLPKYSHYLRRAVLEKIMAYPVYFSHLGTSKEDFASGLLKVLADRWNSSRFSLEKAQFPLLNKWSKQHIFAKVSPIFGWLFAVQPISQFGHEDLVRVETPNHGASMRMIMRLNEENRGYWSFPLGQSGHPNTRFYRSWQKKWEAGSYSPILDPELVWK